MKVSELHQPSDTKVPYDLVDDTIVYMRNDPMFYRQHYFPAMTNLADMHRSGAKVNAKDHLLPMIEKGCDSYCSKYNVARSPEEIYTNEDRNNIMQKIYSEELDQIKKGEYK